MSKRRIICGDIKEEIFGTPINIFKDAIKTATDDEFCIKTNNPQFIEAIEVLCGEENIDFYIYIDGQYCKQDRAMDVYNYLGDVYDIIETIRFISNLGDSISDKKLNKEINEYELKHTYHSEEKCKVDESRFEKYEEIMRDPKIIEAYQTDTPVVIRNSFGNKRVAKTGDWVIKYPDGNLDVFSSLTGYCKIKEKENEDV